MDFTIPFFIKKEKEKFIQEQLQLEIDYPENPKETSQKELENSIVVIEIL